MNDIVDVLEYFAQAGTMLSAQRYVTCGLIFPTFDLIKKALISNTKDSRFKFFLKKELLESINHYWESYDLENNKSLLVSTFLCPKFKQLKFLDANEHQVKMDIIIEHLKECSNKYLVNFDTTNLKKSDTISNMQTNKKKTKIDFSEFDSEDSDQEINNLTFSDRLDREINTYLKMKHKDIDKPLQFWYNQRNILKILSQLASLFLVIPATSVPSECLFSLSGYQCWEGEIEFYQNILVC